MTINTIKTNKFHKHLMSDHNASRILIGNSRVTLQTMVSQFKDVIYNLNMFIVQATGHRPQATGHRPQATGHIFSLPIENI